MVGMSTLAEIEKLLRLLHERAIMARLLFRGYFPWLAVEVEKFASAE